MKSIVIVIIYIGQPPEWFPLYLATCGANPTLSWQIYGDQLQGYSPPANVSLRAMTLQGLILRINDRLKIKLPIDAPSSFLYKIVDFRPAIGLLFEQEIAGFDFFGYGDVDVLYGDLRAFYTEAVLEHQVVSSHEWCLSGHLALLRNEDRLRKAFQRVPRWKKAFATPRNLRFDEDAFTGVFRHVRGAGAIRRFTADLLDPVGRRLRGSNYFVEQFTTPLVPSSWHDGQISHPRTWYWYAGKIYNERDGARSFPYLHFMNYKANRYMNPLYGEKAPWANLPNIMHIDTADYTSGVRIDFEGIHTLSKDDLHYLSAFT